MWAFNVEGTVDLALAISLATFYAAEPLMGPAYWIPALWVPALLVTHYLAFVVLRTYRPGAGGYASRDGEVEQAVAATPRH